MWRPGQWVEQPAEWVWTRPTTSGPRPGTCSSTGTGTNPSTSAASCTPRPSSRSTWSRPGGWCTSRSSSSARRSSRGRCSSGRSQSTTTSATTSRSSTRRPGSSRGTSTARPGWRSTRSSPTTGRTSGRPTGSGRSRTCTRPGTRGGRPGRRGPSIQQQEAVRAATEQADPGAAMPAEAQRVAPLVSVQQTQNNVQQTITNIQNVTNIKVEQVAEERKNKYKEVAEKRREAVQAYQETQAKQVTQQGGGWRPRRPRWRSRCRTCRGRAGPLPPTTPAPKPEGSRRQGRPAPGAEGSGPQDAPGHAADAEGHPAEAPQDAPGTPPGRAARHPAGAGQEAPPPPPKFQPERENPKKADPPGKEEGQGRRQLPERRTTRRRTADAARPAPMVTDGDNPRPLFSYSTTGWRRSHLRGRRFKVGRVATTFSRHIRPRPSSHSFTRSG